MIAGRLVPFGGKTPLVHESAFVAPGAVLIGDVEIGPEASVWYNCVLRGDVNRIRVGARTNIQDGTVVHVDSPRDGKPGYPTLIGEDVLIGHMAMVHGCVLEPRSFVGLGSIVMDGCTIRSGGMLAAGALLPPGREIGVNEVWAGRPAKLFRTLTDDQVTENLRGVDHYRELAKAHAEAISRSAAS